MKTKQVCEIGCLKTRHRKKAYFILRKIRKTWKKFPMSLNLQMRKKKYRKDMSDRLILYQ